MSKPDAGKVVEDYIRATYGKPHEPPSEPPASASEVVERYIQNTYGSKPRRQQGAPGSEGKHE
jgi:hypothetical protein